MWEEVAFDRKAVTSVDWLTYPILDITETPAEVNVVLINHPELPPTGAGEPSIRPVAAAIANAIFDATGVRIRRVPFSPDRVKSALGVDWLTYPILDITETPAEVNVVLINHPELPPTGAGEPSIRPVAAAIANAIFDATGVRIRRVPFSPDRVKSALS